MTIDVIITGSTLIILCLVLRSNRGKTAEKRSGEWLKLALTNIGDAILITDKRGRIILLNEVAEKLSGWKSQEAMAKDWAEVLHLFNHDTRAPVTEPFAKAFETGTVSGWTKNTIMVARGGYEFPIDYNIAPIKRGKRGVSGLILIFRDITERYTAEQKLIESEERMRAVTNEARVGLVMIDRERRYVYANNFYMQMLGIDDAQITGRRIVEVLPLLYEQIRPNLDKAFTGQRFSYELKGVYNKEKGLNRTYSVTYEPQARHGLIMHVVIVILDVTDVRGAS